MKTGRNRDRQRGFTLVELMVVVTIVALVSAAVVPGIRASLHKSRQADAAVLIVQAVYAARSRAARTGRCHRVRVIPSAAQVAGGTGGAVALDVEFVAPGQQPVGCSRALSGQWTRLSYKSIWKSVDVAGDLTFNPGTTHAGLVGDDVAITRILEPPSSEPPVCNTTLPIADPGVMHFEATGGMYQPVERYFEVQSFTRAGLATGVTMYVRVTGGGNARYTLCR